METLFGPANTRKRLFRDLIIVILFTTGAITAVTFIQGANMRNDIAQEHIQQSLTNTSDMISQFYEPVLNNASLIQRWGLAGIWKMDDIASVTAKLIPIMENLPQIKAIKFGCERADAPVFLINKKDESFYVRSGPSSLSLSMRPMLKYLESRK